MSSTLGEKDKNISRSVTDLNSLNSEQLKIRHTSSCRTPTGSIKQDFGGHSTPTKTCLQSHINEKPKPHPRVQNPVLHSALAPLVQTKIDPNRSGSTQAIESIGKLERITKPTMPISEISNPEQSPGQLKS